MITSYQRRLNARLGQDDRDLRRLRRRIIRLRDRLKKGLPR